MQNLPNNPKTNLLDEIRLKLQDIDKTEVVKSMGYNSVNKGLTALNKLLESADTFTWISSGHFDFKYTAKEFLNKLSAILGIDSNMCEEQINNCDLIKIERKKFTGCYVFVNTNFHRTTQPIFVLAALESRRLLSPDRQSVIFKTKKQILRIISEMVKKHYLANEGELMIWGKIDNYIYHHFDGKKYVFDSDGCLIEDADADADDVYESRATISL